MLEAVKETSYALKFASDELQNDPDLKKLAEENAVDVSDGFPF